MRSKPARLRTFPTGDNHRRLSLLRVVKINWAENRSNFVIEGPASSQATGKAIMLSEN
jgi:hypothetical protein